MNKFNSLPRRCTECSFLLAGDGECPKNRMICTLDGEPGLNYPCSGPQKYWQHIDADIKEICRGLAQNQPLRLA